MGSLQVSLYSQSRQSSREWEGFLEAFASHLTVGLLQVLSPSLDNGYETGGSFPVLASHLTVGLPQVLFFQFCRLGVTLPTFRPSLNPGFPFTFSHHVWFEYFQASLCLDRELTNTACLKICQCTSTVSKTAVLFSTFDTTHNADPLLLSHNTWVRVSLKPSHPTSTVGFRPWFFSSSVFD